MTLLLYHQNCLDILPLFPDGSVDCVIADPPYGTTQNKWDFVIDLGVLQKELLRVCRGAIVLTGIQPFCSRVIYEWRDLFRHEWVWEKNKPSNHLNVRHSPLRYHETVMVFSKNGFCYNPQMTEGHKPGNYAKRAQFSTNYGAQKDAPAYGGQTQRFPRSVQYFPVLNNDSPERIHPTQKPVDLMRYLVRTYSNENDFVLDFAMGSGTTGMAAREEKRRFLGIEKDPVIFELARQRLLGLL